MAAVLLSLVPALACGLPAARAADDRASSVGLWDVASVEMNGHEVDAEIAALLQVDYRADGSWAVLFKGLSLVEGTSTHDQEAVPKTFDAETRAGENAQPQKYVGIYRIEDDARVLCFVEEGKPRPDAFAAPRGSGRLLVRLKRPARGARPSVRGSRLTVFVQ